MTTPPQAHPQQPDQAAAAQPDFSVEMHQFWEKNRQRILIGCAVIILAVAGYHVGQEIQSSREEATRAAFAASAGSPAKLQTFANEHNGHALAAVALLQLADTSFASGDYGTATQQYEKAAAQLNNNQLKSRSRLGAAISKLSAGDNVGAETALKAVAADISLEKSIRAEATYHLATQFKELGRIAEMGPLLDEIAALDSLGVWGQRATQLKATLLMKEDRSSSSLGQKQ